MINNITIVGTGNVAFHLLKIFSKKEFEISLIGRNILEIQNFKTIFQVNVLNSFKDINPTSLVFICVSDDFIIEVLNHIPSVNSVVYTSGIVSLESLPKRENLGVFYPLQSLSKNRFIDFSKVPILIEATNDIFSKDLIHLAKTISTNVTYVDSNRRKKIHLAAVFTNNFTNHLLNLAKNQLLENEEDWNLLIPLIEETFQKAIDFGPENAQTGPAKRNDINTIHEHLVLLNDTNKKLYLEFTNQLLKLNGHEEL